MTSYKKLFGCQGAFPVVYMKEMNLIRASIQRSERTPFYSILLTFFIFLNVSVINCDTDGMNDSRVSVCDDGEVRRHF